jgi:hypothetical protein
MRKLVGFWICLSAFWFGAATNHAENLAGRIRKAVVKSTLNQPGTKPFHLNANLAPSLERDKDSGMTGIVEIWWKSPTEWRREVTCPIFHQIQIVNGDQTWQKNDGGYFPEWLRETAVELIDPLPNLKEALDQVDGADVKHMFGTTYMQWMIPSNNGEAKSWIGASVALTDRTGLLFYDGGYGWGGLFHDYAKFHRLMVARTVSVGSPEVTAKIATLEDLQESADLFQIPAPVAGAEGVLIRTVVVDETTARLNLLQRNPIAWPGVKNGPLAGVATAEVVIDRQGNVREIGPIVSGNDELNDFVRQQIEGMHFKPFIVNGSSAQVVTRITLSFNASRSS